jgi:hypothetical protein
LALFLFTSVICFSKLIFLSGNEIGGKNKEAQFETISISWVLFWFGLGFGFFF